MRIWDVPPGQLCRKHLLGEHRELHAVWTILTENKSGYSNHPETKRWRGKTQALYERHDQLVVEMTRRGYRHRSPLDLDLATGSRSQDELVTSLIDQRQLLAQKDCDCYPQGGTQEASAASAERS
jgi:hypothetical protein